MPGSGRKRPCAGDQVMVQEANEGKIREARSGPVREITGHMLDVRAAEAEEAKKRLQVIETTVQATPRA